jgi:translation initiation factor IF-1
MPPNKKGGKAYKKMKTGEKEEVEFIDIQRAQFVARAVRVLGNRNILCFCHDNVVRICHIPRGMKGHSPDKLIEVGDIILVSLRDFTTAFLDPKTSTAEQLRAEKEALDKAMKTITRGDVIAKYPPEQVRWFKKEGAYPKLFLKLEDAKEVNLDAVGEEIGAKVLDSMNEEDDVFEHGEESESEEEEEASKIVDKREKVNHRAGGREVREGHEIKQAEKDVTFDEL